MFDVITVGGGPSGLNVARRLSEQGLDVVVLEKKDRVGEDVVCTGIIGQDVFKDFGLPQDSVLNEIKRVKLFSPSGSSLIYEHPKSFASVVDRQVFDRSLCELALRSGARIRTRSEVVRVSVNTHNVEVITRSAGKDQKANTCKMLVLATGNIYKLHKSLGLGYPKRFLNGVQAELDVDGIDCPHVFLGETIAPGAFGWAVPLKNGRSRIGLITEKDPNGYIRHLMTMFFPEIRERDYRRHIHHKVIAQGLVARPYGERVLAVGESAGQIKTTTGGGIYFGLLCSEIASRVVAQRLDENRLSASDLAEYGKSCQKALQKEIKTGLMARRLYTKLSEFQVETMFDIAKNNGVFPLIRDKGRFDWQSELILTMLRKPQFLGFLKPHLSRMHKN